MIAANLIIWMEEIGTVLILLIGDAIIKLHNIALAPNCNINLISLGQFWESKITYHNKLMAMILMQKRKVIAYAKKKQNLFILNLASSG